MRLKRPSGRKISLGAKKTTSSKSGKTAGKSTFKRGSSKGNSRFSSGSQKGRDAMAGFRRAKVENAKAEDRRRRNSLPWDFYIPAPGTAKTIMLSKAPYFMYEHDFEDASGQRTKERCIKETGSCPLCSKTGREGYYCMKVDILDLRGYKPKPGSKSPPQKVVKRIMTVKQGQMPKFERFYTKNGKNLRGVKLEHARDGKKEAVNGSDITQIGKLSERELAAKYDADLIKETDFDEAYPVYSEKQLAEKYGVRGAAGSKDFEEDPDEDDDDDDNEGWG